MRHIEREKHEQTLTMADLCQAIKGRQAPYIRQGDDYVLRQSDVRKLRARLGRQLDRRPEPFTGDAKLEVGRSA